MNLQWVEHELIAAIGILLPAVQLVVHGQRHTLLKASIVICGQSADHASHLDSQADVEVL